MNQHIEHIGESPSEHSERHAAAKHTKVQSHKLEQKLSQSSNDNDKGDNSEDDGENGYQEEESNTAEQESNDNKSDSKPRRKSKQSEGQDTKDIQNSDEDSEEIGKNEKQNESEPTEEEKKVDSDEETIETANPDDLRFTVPKEVSTPENIDSKLLEKIEYFLPISKRIYEYPKSTRIPEKLANTVVTALRANCARKNLKTLADLRSKSIELKKLQQFQIEIETSRPQTKYVKKTPLNTPLVLYSQSVVDMLSQKS